MVNATVGSTPQTPQIIRDVDWKQVVFIAAGVPALVLFSMGGISATIGAPAWLVWTISVLFGFAQSFTYAEIAGLHPSKTGGTAVHGATAGFATAGFSRRCHYGRTGWPGPQCSRSVRVSARAICCPSSLM